MSRYTKYEYDVDKGGSLARKDIEIKMLRSRLLNYNMGKLTMIVSSSFFFVFFAFLIFTLITSEAVMNSILNSLFILMSIGFYFMGTLINKSIRNKFLENYLSSTTTMNQIN